MSTDLTSPHGNSSTWLGHPGGLFLLFFVEMWERFSYYGMRALLMFYMIKGFLKLDDSSASGIYGAYTALVYATPFIGGMLADKLLGARRAVVLGGMLMAAGHLLMMFEDKSAFYVALALLICGNGFFKPNISTMVGAMYPPGSPRRDGGFTIFYMGINLGAAMSPLICGYVGETFGWHWGFGLATIGMLTGLLTFVVHTKLSRVLIGMTALVTAGSMVWFHFRDPLQLFVNAPIGIALVIAAAIAIAALAGGGLPDNVGQPKNSKVGPNLAVYFGTALAVPVAAILLRNTAVVGIILGIFGGGALLLLLVDAIRAERIERERMFVVLILMFFSMLFFAFFEQAGSSVSLFTDRNVDRIVGGRELTTADIGQKLARLPITSAMLGRKVAGREWDLQMIDSTRDVARKTIMDAPADATNDDIQAAVDKAALVELDRLGVVKAQAKEKERQKKEGTQVKSDAKIPVGEPKPDGKAGVDEPKEAVVDAGSSSDWNAKLQRVFLSKELHPTLDSVEVTDGMVGMKVDGREVKASLFQAANPIFILVLGLPLALLWSFLGTHRMEPNTAIKFALGLLQLGLGFAVFWFGTTTCSTFGIVAMSWLLLGYLLHTSGELCLSPVGLSMVTKLSPARMVSTVMGAWFLAAAFSNYLAGLIAALTGVHSEEGAEVIIKLPIETVHVYGDVFAKIAIAGCVSGIVLLCLSPLLVRWMHEEHVDEEATATT